MNREFTCIVCPRGCHITVDEHNNVSGNFCPRGKIYVLKEMSAPERTLTSSIRITNRENCVVSVKTSKPIPKGKIFAIMEEINKVGVDAPTHIGDVAIKNVLGTGADIVITKNSKYSF